MTLLDKLQELEERGGEGEYAIGVVHANPLRSGTEQAAITQLASLSPFIPKLVAALAGKMEGVWYCGIGETGDAWAHEEPEEGCEDCTARTVLKELEEALEAK